MQTTCGIPVTGEAGIDLAVAMASAPFANWLRGYDRSGFKVSGVHFQSVDMFGKRVGFVKFKCEATDAHDKRVPGIIFARGGAVAVLPVLHCEGKLYTVVTVQPRIATGIPTFEEVCAGMLDGDSNFAGVAAKELKEELEIELGEKDLTNLSELAGKPDGFWLSPGGCDETIRIYAFARNVTRQWLDNKNGQCTGALNENEQITLKIVELDYIANLPDAKSIVAHTYYNRFRDQVPVV